MYARGAGSPSIAKTLGVSTGKIVYFLSHSIGLRSCKEAAKKYHCDDHFFDEIDSEPKSYWLGFMCADGYVSRTKYGKNVGLTLSSEDIAHIEKFKEAIKFDGPIHTYAPSKSSTNYSTNSYSRMLVTSDIMFDSLVKHGAVEHKTNVLKAPKISPKWKKDFIRGYLDGDGCISRCIKNGKYIEYAIKILGTTELLDYVKEFVEDNEIAVIRRYYQRKPGQTVRTLEFSGNYQVKRFLDLLYDGAHIFLDRKRERYIDLCNLLNSRAVRKRSA